MTNPKTRTEVTFSSGFDAAFQTVDATSAVSRTPVMFVINAGCSGVGNTDNYTVKERNTNANAHEHFFRWNEKQNGDPQKESVRLPGKPTRCDKLSVGQLNMTPSNLEVGHILRTSQVVSHSQPFNGTRTNNTKPCRGCCLRSDFKKQPTT